MAEHDLFREIAMMKHPAEATDKEIEPLDLDVDYFEVLDSKGKKEMEESLFQPEKSFDEKCMDYDLAIMEMRKKYQPFMENRLKDFKSNVEIKEISDFEFRYLDDGERFTDRNRKEAIWEKVIIPDYRGPGEEKGKWRAYYRHRFDCTQKVTQTERMILRFQCVDYIALIYLNGNFVGRHEGFFAPFEFDVTDYLDESNELIIECRNDISILGVGPVLDGDKIYGATGPGWDDPVDGWHHCPAGAGVFGKVTLEKRPEIHIDNIFVRSDIDQDGVEIRVGIMNYGKDIKRDYEILVNLKPKNLSGQDIGSTVKEIPYIGIGKNEYRYWIPVKDYKLWESESPYLYGAVTQVNKDGRQVSSRLETFGFKKFISDESSFPKGKLYLNNRPVILRGANEMGHLQQCVMNGDFDQLVDDILIAKYCNMNYYRMTQRPVQEEIYEYFDMLGMMHQSDLPLFGFLRRNQFSEAIRQTEEMENLVRKHVSTVMVTFINEPMCIRRTEDPNSKFSKRYNVKGHRHLMRDELEAFFEAARQAVYVQNPDRVIKNVEGDYDGPTKSGMPDFHTYTMWYTNHGQPIGRLMKGYLPPIKAGWMTGCGEYGAEGLDHEHIMRERYPKEWLETDENGNWYPDKIVRAQTHSVHGDWYPEQTNITDWVEASQNHQANATKLMTDSFRRRADLINHTAIHLLIDAWPSGWMKTLVACDRKPKKAYFAYKEALEPLRINLYTGRSHVYAGETIDVEAWILNDLGQEYPLTVKAELSAISDGKVSASYEMKALARPAGAVCSGKIPVTFDRDQSGSWRLTGAIINEEGHVVNRESINIEVHRNPNYDLSVKILGQDAELMAGNLDLRKVSNSQAMISSDLSSMGLSSLETHVRGGGRGLLLVADEIEISVGEVSIATKKCQPVFFADRNRKYSIPNLTMLYDKNKGYIDHIGKLAIEDNGQGHTLLFSYGKSSFDGSKGAKKQLPFVRSIKIGKGRLFILSLMWKNKLGVNPQLDKLILEILASESLD